MGRKYRFVAIEGDHFEPLLDFFELELIEQIAKDVQLTPDNFGLIDHPLIERRNPRNDTGIPTEFLYPRPHCHPHAASAVPD